MLDSPSPADPLVQQPGSSLPADESATAGAPEGEDADASFSASMIGRFVVIGELGRGAMGQVLRAYDPKLLREVAIKLVRVRGHMASARMLREAQALAQLNHPNVVAIYDVGEQQDTVFIAMEYVRGRTLRQWLEDERPDWRKAVELVQAAGRGLAAAHRAGLVHRDVKPDNILVADDGRVRVVDFGLARPDRMTGESFEEGDAATSWSDPSSSLTRTGTVMGTLAYMAPEQHLGAIADARSDQYSLCVTLFELLYGRRPFDGAVEELGIAKLSRAVEVPAVPRVPRVIVQAILRGLSPSADDRWPSIDALLAELARDPPRARRRAVLVIGGLVIVAAGFGVHRLDRARTAAACAADGEVIASVWNDDARTAVREGLVATGSAAAERTAEQLMPWLDRYAQDWQEGRTEACLDAELRGTSSVDALERAQWCFEDRLTELQGFVAELEVADPETVHLATPAAARLSSIEPCRDRELLGRLPAPPAEGHDEVRAIRATLSRAQALLHAGRFSQALELDNEALLQAEARAWPPLIAAARLGVAHALARKSELEGAQAAAEAAFIEAASSGSWDVATDAATLLVKVVGRQMARYPDGLRWSRLRALAVANLGGEDELREAEYLYELAMVLTQTGDYPGAIAADETALEIAERRLGPEHPTVAEILFGLAHARQSSGDYPGAERLGSRSLAIREAAFGPEHPAVAQSLLMLSSLEQAAGDLEAAQAMIERALAIYVKTHGPENPHAALCLLRLGNVVATTGDLALGRRHMERALELLERTLGPSHIDVARALDGLAALEEMTNLPRARALNDRALAIAEQTFGPDHIGVVQFIDSAANMSASEGKLEAAAALRERGLAIRERALGRENLLNAPLLDNLGIDYTDLGRYADARAVFERSRVIMARTLAPGDVSFFISEMGLGRLDLLEHQPELAIDHFERAIAMMPAGVAPAYVADARFALAQALWAKGERSRAHALAVEVAESLKDPKLAPDPLRAEVEAWLGEHAAG